jgi:8-oxo-dGTP pyrophosphatase MutT (NUDIX family)
MQGGSGCHAGTRPVASDGLRGLRNGGKKSERSAGRRQGVAKREQINQIAALPVQWQNGKLRVLMVTSRRTRRWIMPKGWTMNGKKPWQVAEIEALEEAGALGFISKISIGTYRYKKKFKSGRKVSCLVTVYPMKVEKLKRRWKENGQRTRHWFSLKKASRLVKDRELGVLLNGLSLEPFQK